MPTDFLSAQSTLKRALSQASNQLTVKADTAAEYALVSKKPSPFAQHKGHPLEFASVRMSKSYVSLHLMPVYMSPALRSLISPALGKHMHGKSCFNFKHAPSAEVLQDICELIEAALAEWTKLGWI